MKVMRIVTRMNIGGPSLHVSILTEGLRARGYETMLVAGKCEEHEGDIVAPVASRMPFTELAALSRSISPVRDAAAIVNAYRIIRRERPDIVHTHTAKAGLVGRIAAWFARVPYIVHTYHGNSLSGYFSPLVTPAFRAIERTLARVTDRICVVSEQQFHELSRNFRIGRPEQYAIVPLGLELASELEQKPAEYTGCLNVGWLGRMVEVKCVRLLAATIDETYRRGLPVKFFVGGDGPDRRLMERVVARYGRGRVWWPGWERDVPAFLAKCHVLLQTSLNEGTPVALIQGMAAARPFISTPVGGVVDLVHRPAVLETGHCTWFANGVFASADAGAFADALARFQQEPSLLADMGASARKFASERFRAERLITDIDNLYRGLVQSEFGVPTIAAASPS